MALVAVSDKVPLQDLAVPLSRFGRFRIEAYAIAEEASA